MTLNLTKMETKSPLPTTENFSELSLNARVLDYLTVSINPVVWPLKNENNEVLLPYLFEIPKNNTEFCRNLVELVMSAAKPTKPESKELLKNVLVELLSTIIKCVSEEEAKGIYFVPDSDFHQ